MSSVITKMREEAQRHEDEARRIYDALMILEEFGVAEEGTNGAAPPPRREDMPAAAAPPPPPPPPAAPRRKQSPLPPPPPPSAPKRKHGEIQCPACDQVGTRGAIASHVGQTHKLPKGHEFLAERFDRLVDSRGISSKGLAAEMQRRLGFTSNTAIDNYRKGRGVPGVPVIEALEEILDARGELVKER